MKNITLPLGFFFLGVSAVLAVTPWVMTLGTPKSVYLPGEPIYVRLEMKNVGSSPSPFPGFHERYYLDDSANQCAPRDLPIAEAPPPEPVAQGSLPQPRPGLVSDPPGATRSTEGLITYWCNLEIGRKDLIGKHKVCARTSDKTREACIQFEIVSPVGVDKQVYDKLPPSLRDVLHDSSLVPKDLLSDYPTSTYAAWAYIQSFQWWKSTQNASTFLEMLQKTDYPGANVLRGADGQPISDGKGGYKFQSGKEWMQSLISQGEPILKAHGDDLYLGPRLRMDLALANIAIGKHETARALFDEITKNAPSSDLSLKAKEYLDAMKKAGLVP